jgi:hypothetical protein
LFPYLYNHTIVTDVNVYVDAAWGAWGNTSFRFLRNPEPWIASTVTWDSYVKGRVWNSFWPTSPVLCFISRKDPNVSVAGWTSPAWLWDDSGGSNPRNLKPVVQSWLDNPGANYGVALFDRNTYSANACIHNGLYNQALPPRMVFRLAPDFNLPTGAYPASGATNVPTVGLVLSWTGAGVFSLASHNVYFGTDFNEVNNATDANVYPGRGNQDLYTTIYPKTGSLTLDYAKTYYWRIDEVNTMFRVMKKGKVWYFTTTLGKALYPVPRTDANGIEGPLVLSWTPGAYVGPDVNGHDFYLGTSQADVNAATPGNPLSVYKGRLRDPNYVISSTLPPLTTYYWRVDEVNTTGPVTGTWRGDIWNFTSIGIGEAINPVPTDGSTVADLRTVTLSWRRGDWTMALDGHDLYFGTVYNDVCDANRMVHPGVTYVNLDVNNYDPRPLEFSTTYYWRVDEMNKVDISGEPNVWFKGAVWSFTVPAFISVENFDAYGDDTELHANWDPNFAPDCAYGFGQGGWVYDDGGGMRYTYDNTGTTYYYFSELRRDFGASGMDWSTGSASELPKALALSYRGQLDNSINPTYDRMYIGVEDTAGHQYFINNSDPDAQLNPAWQQWNIALSQFSSHGVDLLHVRYLYLGFGQHCNLYGPAGGTGTVWFEDVRLYPSRCLPDLGPVADLTGDCTVDLADAAFMFNQWLNTDSDIVISPIQQPAAPVLLYEFADGSGTNVTDSAGTYNGTLRVASGWQAGGGFDGGACLALDGTDQSIMIPPTVISDNVNTDMTISTWIKVDPANFPQSQTWVPFVRAAAISGEPNSGFDIWLPTPSAPLFPSGPAVHFRFTATPADDLAECYGLGESAFTGRWHHYAFVKKGSTGFIGIYHNGQPLCPPNTDDVNVAQIIVESITLGNFGWFAGGWAGSIDDLRIYDYGLSEAEIGYLATNGTGNLHLPLETPADMYKSTPPIINFKDLAVLAQNWMVQQYFP